MSEIKKVLVHNFFNWKEPMSYLAWAIRKMTGKFYNHAGLLVNIHGRDYLIHAIYPRVQIIDFQEWYSQKSRIVAFEEVEYINIDDVRHKALEQVGKKYDLVSLFIKMPYYILTDKDLTKNENKAHEKLYCYELVEYVLGEKLSHIALPRKKQ